MKMLNTHEPIKVPVGAIRMKNDDSIIPIIRPQGGPSTTATRENSHSIASNTALASLCDSKYSRNKRKSDLKKGSDFVRKVLIIDDDVKTKKSQRRFDDFDSSLLKDSITRDVGPQVEIINGQIVLKESSLVITNQEVGLTEGEYEEVEEGVHASSRYSSFSKKRKSTIWSLEETKEFYKALQQCGTEFSVMEFLCPNRTRKELKMKFFREENQHPELVKRALESSLPLEWKAFEDAFKDKRSASNGGAVEGNTDVIVESNL